MAFALMIKGMDIHFIRRTLCFNNVYSRPSLCYDISESLRINTNIFEFCIKASVFNVVLVL